MGRRSRTPHLQTCVAQLPEEQADFGREWLAALDEAADSLGNEGVNATIPILTGVGGWVPFAAPGVWAASATPTVDASMVVQLWLVVPVSAFAALAAFTTTDGGKRCGGQTLTPPLAPNTGSGECKGALRSPATAEPGWGRDGR